MLGYTNIFHGFELPSTRANDCIIWVPLLQAKDRGDISTVEAFDFDTVLGDCDCVLDAPPCIFAKELLDFYPHAKVILNRRRDVDVWHRSMIEAVNALLNNWILWTLSFFDAQLFWWFWTPTLCFKILANGKFEQIGKQVARDHYDGLEAKLQEDGRDYLNWEVTEGWAPLCKFLDRKVPSKPFPSGNKSGKEFEKNMIKAIERMVKRAALKAFSVFVVLSCMAVLVWWTRLPGH
ncbi:hypothetical protein EDD37DRAFT_273612 [Exophiala viscosa]|uniref:Uncharacterized protein n=1 Tax=Exophiala viscosa TaxID=2486360 RepID=A0AAN6E7R7_9EURO|nr:hypothetical protein EDD36DRAFT_36052 [Exophiala viscosa]KAI1627721.1 hypothetical protein EDD37DRAFT_273612 [Exophiala viscosa]